MLRALRWLLVLVLVAAALWRLRGDLPSILAVVRTTHPRWSLVVLASALTLGTYALLIESWRRALRELGGHLSFAEAAVVWLGSNLARYIPGAGWQIGVMGAMARERGVTLVASTGASILMSIASVLTGLAVCLAGLALLSVGPGAVPSVSPRALALVVIGAAGLVASPWLMPRAASLASRLSGREIVLPRLTGHAALVAFAGTAVSWVAYGVAFWLLARALGAPGSDVSLAGCITLYTFSYLVGLFNPMPAGIGVTEPVIIFLAPQLGVASATEAAVLALVVRAWRTVMEMVPSLVAVGFASVSRRSAAGS